MEQHKGTFISKSTPAGTRPETKSVGKKGPQARGGTSMQGYMPHGPNNLATSKGATK